MHLVVVKYCILNIAIWKFYKPVTQVVINDSFFNSFQIGQACYTCAYVETSTFGDIIL